MKDFRNLRVWEKAHRLTLDIYKTTGRFPREELYGLSSQMRVVALLSLPTSPKDVASAATTNFSDTCRSPPVLQVNWTIISCSHETCSFSVRLITTRWLKNWEN
jgi:hypothetical protein